MRSVYHKTSGLSSVFNVLRVFQQALFKTERFDLLHCHLSSLSYLAPVRIARLHGVPVILHAHNAGLTGTTLGHVLHYINRIILPRKDTEMIAPSQFAVSFMFASKDPVTLISNAVVPEEYLFDGDARKALRASLGAEGNAKIILHVGSFKKEKNHPFVVSVFAEFLKAEPTAQLLLVGDGTLRSSIESQVKQQRIGKSVRFLGIRHDIQQLLSASDVLLYPSISEGFSLAVLEAQISGLPCLASDAIPDEAVFQSTCVRLPLSASASEWSNLLEKICQAPPDRNSIDLGNLPQEITMAENAASILRIYRKLGSYCRT